MSRTRQRSDPEIRSSAVTYSLRYTWRGRKSDWAQLVFASRGVMTVQTDAGMWIVPPHQALWVPAAVNHSIEVAAHVAIRTLYLSSALERRLPTNCQVVEVSGLLREVLRRAMQLGTLSRRNPHERHLMDVLLDQLTALPLVSIDLRMPRDPRGARAASLMRTGPEARHKLADVARHVGASARTLERLFRTETGLAFGAWRQRARLLRALQLLAEGETVTGAAIAVGYESTSAFVAAFRRTLGQTPGRYFRRRAADDEVDSSDADHRRGAGLPPPAAPRSARARARGRKGRPIASS